MSGTSRSEGATRGKWGSQLGFILAAAGSAVGLGNIWRFPYVAGESGGGAFIAIYVICVAVLGLPIMLSEMALGRASQRNPVGAFKVLKPGTPWFLVGGMGVICGFVILSFYAVVAGWTLGYFVESVRGSLSGVGAEQISDHFEEFTKDPLRTTGYFVLMVALSLFIVARGVKGGIERWSIILMPALFVLLLLIVVRSLTLPGAGAGMEFIFQPDFSKLNPDVLLKAMGQAFFSMSLGMGAMLTYGSYLGRDRNMPRSALFIGGLDLLVALLGGMALFPALFAFGMDPQAGPGLVFKTLPVIFDQIPMGQFFMSAFFLLLVVAALTSTISLVEVVAAYFIDERGWSRRKSVMVMGIGTILLGIPSALSTGVLSTDRLGFDFMSVAGHLSADYMLPIGALFLSLFTGFAWKREDALKEVREGAAGFGLAEVWLFTVRFAAPFIVGQIILLGLLNEFDAMKGTVNVLTDVLSLVDAVLVVLLLAKTAVFIGRKKAG